MQEVGAEAVDRADARLLELRDGLVEAGRAAPSPASAACRACSSSARSRSFISPAAFSVNVTATTLCTVPRPSASTATSRATSSLVLPVPAAASTTIVASSDAPDALARVGVDEPGHWQLPQLVEVLEGALVLPRDAPLLDRARTPGEVAHGTGSLARRRRQEAPRDGAVDQLDHLEPAARGWVGVMGTTRSENSPARVQ